MVGAEHGQLGAGQNSAVTPGLTHGFVDGGKLLPAAPLSLLDLVVDNGHHQGLNGGIRGHSLQPVLGAGGLVQPGLDGAVGGQNGGTAAALGVDGGGSLPNHVENGGVKVPLQLVHKVVGGVAGDGDGGAAAVLQQLGVSKQPLIQGLGVPGKDGGGAVGHFGVGQDESGQVLLVTAGFGAVQHILIEDLGGLGAHAPQNAQLLFSHIRNLP